MTEKVTPREARQGRKGFHVLTILLVSIGLALVAWGILELVWN